ncbi:hypothetical protein Trco_007613 [Trichoderma cornu-damae]|uniref:Transmembrane protein n=1 Tax=Trichoderma cornu-damae TaxID=654480 RepID=A0A9P8QKT2_9HYPO|nr:hypothetical protein Trco_007613 [Trichoderma cornu-damae]
MAIRVTSLLLTILYVSGLVMSAPTTAVTTTTTTTTTTATTASLPLAAITKRCQGQVASERASGGVKAKRARLFRVDRALWEKLSESDQPTKYFLDSTLDVLETSQNVEVMPVFASDEAKSVIVDTNGDLMASYGSDKFVPVWSRGTKHHGPHRPHAVGQRFALFILGFSLSLALACSCMIDAVEKGVVSEPRDEEASQDGGKLHV